MEGIMTIIAVIAISVLSTLATVALLLFAIKRYWQRRWQPGRKHHTHALMNSRKDPLAFVESVLQLDAEQLAVWHPLKQEILESQQDLAAYCEALIAAGDLEQAINRWEDFVNDGLIVLRKLKPKMLDFFNSLSSQQQHKVNAMLNGRFVKHRRCSYHC
jgi:hypothetical protein